MPWIRWFIAGALAVPLCHQVVLALFNAAGWVSRQPFAMTPTKPFGVPAVVSLAFWGGVWGIILGLLLSSRRRAASFWLIALVVGAVAPTLVAMSLVPLLKGEPIVTDAKFFLGGLILNGAWGLGTAALYRLMSGGLRKREA